MIGGLGSSLGGEVLLGAASAYPDIKAIAADGATTRSLDELLALPSERPLVRNLTARVMYAAVQILSGETPPEPLLDSMVAAPSTSYLLIAGGGNQREVDFNELFAAATPDRSQLWIAPGASHTGAFGLYPAEYEQRVIAFFDAALLDEIGATVEVLESNPAQVSGCQSSDSTIASAAHSAPNAANITLISVVS